MEEYKRGSHTVWDCKYHLVWTTKYRYEVLVGDVGQRCRELLREIAQSIELVIYAGSINRDHVHMLIGIPPNVSVSRAVQHMKGKAHTSCSVNMRVFGNATGVSTCGREAIG
jgi:putative transposase